MVRTRADAPTTRVAGAKAPRKNLAGPSDILNPGGNKGREQSGGNPYCPRETPKWQKQITSFFKNPPESGESSKRKEQTEFLDGESSAVASTSGGGSASKEDTD